MMKFTKFVGKRSNTRPEQSPTYYDQSPRSVTSSGVRKSEQFDDLFDSRLSRDFQSVPVGPDGTIQTRSISAQRSGSSRDMRILGTENRQPDEGNRSRRSASAQPRRSASAQPQRFHPQTITTTDSDHSGDKKRKSKMEKIRQLQAKNDLYKEEYKRVQKDRKRLKGEIENKKLEIASLTKEIDTYIAETSVLKDKLSEALQQLDRTDVGSRKEKVASIRMQKDLSQARGDLDSAQQRISHLKEDVMDLREQVKRKDQQIESLTEEVTVQAQSLQALEDEVAHLRSMEPKNDNETLQDMMEENERLNKELGSTLERAASMVKEREDAIADLLKENEEIKQMAEEQKNQEPAFSEEELMQLKDDVHNAHAALEEAQDRNVILEEDIEAWIQRGAEMEAEIERLRDDLDSMERKASAAQESVAVIEKSAEDARAEAMDAKETLKNTEERFNKRMAEVEIKHRTALLEEREKTRQAMETARQLSADADERSNVSERSRGEASDAQAKQANFLEQAVANRQKKTPEQKGTSRWLSGFYRGQEEEEELDENQKRIKELEAVKADQEQEIQKLKSELVRMRSTYNETIYTNKKKIEQLETENEAYALKTTALETELAHMRNQGANPFD